MNIKKIISILLVIFCISAIFIFSGQNSQKSLGLSSKIIVKTSEIIHHRELTPEEKNKVIIKYTYRVRKCAHFTIYLILGVSVIFLLSNFKIKKRIILYSIILCLIYAITDEIHQGFVSGRTPLVLDVIIDTCGSTFGIIFVYFTFLRKKLINKK